MSSECHYHLMWLWHLYYY